MRTARAIRARPVSVALVVAGACLAALAGCSGGAGGQTLPRETFLAAVAVDFDAPQLCERIAPQGAAAALHASCVGGRPVDLPAPQHFVAIMRELGYDEHTVAFSRWNRTPLKNPVRDAYREALDDRRFVARLLELPSREEPFARERIRTAEPEEVLFHQVAVDLDRAELCGKISPNAVYPNVFDRRLDLPELVRNRCYGAVAFNTSDLELCAGLLPEASIPDGLRPGYTRENCESQVGHRLAYPDIDRGRRSALPFKSVEDLAGVLAALDRIDPAALSADPGYFHEFYTKLVRSRDERRRREFVDRVQRWSAGTRPADPAADAPARETRGAPRRSRGRAGTTRGA